ncbi:MAG: tyrosine-type recombinase/integrase [Actinobacteria bacterium]|nr:tyrosine-type recombinase/integrase [Actinomycetota bacterium]
MKTKRTRRPPRKLPMVLSKPAIGAMISNCSCRSRTGLRTRALITIMAGAGLRCDEVTSLKPGNVRWSDNLIEVRNGKGGKDRNIPVHPDDMAILRAWDEKRPSGARWFFTTHKAAKLDNRYVRDAIKRAAVRAKLPDAEKVSPHTLRHSFATNKLADGSTLAEVRDALGHENIETTNIYLHVRPKPIEGPPMCSQPQLRQNVLVANIATKTTTPNRLPNPSASHGRAAEEMSETTTPERSQFQVLDDWRKLPAPDRIDTLQRMLAEMGTAFLNSLTGSHQ